MTCAAPVLGICGWSGAGKTTLLEALIPRLAERGLAAALVKHDAHGFTVDREGKDSDRLFRAGATVTLTGPADPRHGGTGEQFQRRHAGQALELEPLVAELAREHDLVLVEGHKATPFEKVWLDHPAHDDVPPEVHGVIARLPRDVDRVAGVLDLLGTLLPARWAARPVRGGLLVGGHSQRMGSPKQLLVFHGRSLAEIAWDAIGAADSTRAPGAAPSRLVLGDGPLPPALADAPRLPDVPGVAGPAAGALAAHRWDPDAAWVIVACDHPRLTGEAVRWLVAQRRPGTWGVVPRQPDGHAAPECALYEPQALRRLERRMRERAGGLAALLDHPKIATPVPPSALANAWCGVNTPDEFARLGGTR